MRFPSYDQTEELRRTWTDRFVRVRPGRPEYARFEGKVGRVVTVNFAGKALVDFADGAWYDLPDFETVLVEVTDPAERAKYDPTANSAQKTPARQG